MKKIVIPAILTATILVAGMFALMPVEKASTVHSTLSGVDSISVSDTDITGGTDVYTLDCDADVIVLAVITDFDGTDSTDEEFNVDIEGEDFVVSANGAATVAIDALFNTDISMPSTNDLEVSAGAGTYTGDSVIITASVLKAGTTSCTFTETA